MGKSKRHWTEKSLGDFLYRIGADFVGQIEDAMDYGRVNQKGFAARLKITEGRVSQILNNPGNLTLKKIVQYSRALGRKVAIVAYDDNDPDNVNGPIDSEIFVRCWELAGSPSDFFALGSATNKIVMYQIGAPQNLSLSLAISGKATTDNVIAYPAVKDMTDKNKTGAEAHG